MKLTELKPLENNPFMSRGDEQIKLISKSIEDFQKMLSIRKIVIDENNEILGGNKRYFALKMLGYKDIPDEWIDKRTDLTEEEKKRFIVTDNAHYGSTWDNEMLKEWGATEEWGVDLADWGEKVLKAVEDDFDATPPEEPKTVLGDLYEIGEHRLLCGDSTCSDTVAKLMNGEKADMVFTDPPYGMFLDTNYDQMFANDKNHKKTGERFDKVKGDHNDFVPELINTIFACFNDTKEVFIWGADYFSELIPNRTEGSWVVWDKRCDENMDKVSGNTFELCWSKQKHKRLLARILWSGHHGMHKDDTKTRVHPTQKPTELAKWFFNQWGKEKDLIADLFLGSGSTMVASHQLKRKCYGMELDCKYCDVIVNRMIKLDPTLKVKLNGVDVTNDWN